MLMTNEPWLQVSLEVESSDKEGGMAEANADSKETVSIEDIATAITEDIEEENTVQVRFDICLVCENIYYGYMVVYRF